MGHGWLLVCLQIDVSKISIKFEYVRSVVFFFYIWTQLIVKKIDKL